MKRFLLTLVLLFCALPALAEGDALLIASGAGYKTVIEPLATAYTAETGVPVERIYGNMAQILGQAKTSGMVDLLIGEASFLKTKDLPLGDSTELGKGKLVLAWPKDKPAVTDLTADSVHRIALPDTTKAIYGRAATQYLEKSGLQDKIQSKLLVVGTVPQVFTYLASGEVDAGFLNLTQAVSVKEQIGGYTEIDPSLYAPISIDCFALTTSTHAQAIEGFRAFLGTDKAKAIIAAHGL